MGCHGQMSVKCLTEQSCRDEQKGEFVNRQRVLAEGAAIEASLSVRCHSQLSCTSRINVYPCKRNKYNLHSYSGSIIRVIT